jgi:hypothetical protein
MVTSVANDSSSNILPPRRRAVRHGSRSDRGNSSAGTTAGTTFGKVSKILHHDLKGNAENTNRRQDLIVNVADVEGVTVRRACPAGNQLMVIEATTFLLVATDARIEDDRGGCFVPLVTDGIVGNNIPTITADAFIKHHPHGARIVVGTTQAVLPRGINNIVIIIGIPCITITARATIFIRDRGGGGKLSAERSKKRSEEVFITIPHPPPSLHSNNVAVVSPAPLAGIDGRQTHRANIQPAIFVVWAG